MTDGPVSDERHAAAPAMTQVRLSRRAFLRATTLTALGTAAGSRALAGRHAPEPWSVPPPMQLAADPIGELAATLDYDLERIFRHVADEIAYEPYEGGLRGAVGTLESGAGNSVDKTTLLAALLAASFIDASIVEGRLEEAAADGIRSAWLADIDTLQTRSDGVLKGTGFRGSGASGAAPVASGVPVEALPADARALIERTVADADTAVSLASGMLDTGVRTIIDALVARGIAIPATDDALPVLERDRHVWLRVRQGPEWLDLDPTLADTALGQVIASPVVTDLPAIPDDLRHRVEIRATVERISGDALEQEVVLEHLAFADQLAGLPVVFSHEQPDGLKAIGVGMMDALVGTRSYQPVLQVADLLHVGLVGVTLAGSDEDSPLGALGAGQRDGEATAEWLQVVTVAPSGTRSVADRVLFDRVGAEARAAGVDVTTIPPVELQPLAPDGPPEYAPLTAIHFLAVATGATGPRPARFLGTDDGSAWPMYLVGHLYHTARDAAAVVVAAERGVRVLHDAPNVVRYTLENVPGTLDGDFSTSIDILHRSFRTGDVVGRSTAQAPGVVAGVLSHVIERLTMGAGDAAGSPTNDGDVSVGAILDRAAAQGVATVVTAPGDDLVATALDTPARTTLLAALDAGWVAIGPERPVVVGDRERIGWWLFDPVTGRVIDRLDDGRGIAMVENALQRYAAWLARHPYLKLGLCIAMCIGALYNLLQAMDGNIARVAVGGASLAGPLKGLACA